MQIARKINEKITNDFDKVHEPSCDSNGKFATQQCWDTQGYCWCVDIDGNEVEGTKTTSSPVCPKRKYYHVTIT